MAHRGTQKRVNIVSRSDTTTAAHVQHSKGILTKWVVFSPCGWFHSIFNRAAMMTQEPQLRWKAGKRPGAVQSLLSRPLITTWEAAQLIAAADETNVPTQVIRGVKALGKRSVESPHFLGRREAGWDPWYLPCFANCPHADTPRFVRVGDGGLQGLPKAQVVERGPLLA